MVDYLEDAKAIRDKLLVEMDATRKRITASGGKPIDGPQYLAVRFACDVSALLAIVKESTELRDMRLHPSDEQALLCAMLAYAILNQARALRPINMDIHQGGHLWVDAISDFVCEIGRRYVDGTTETFGFTYERKRDGSLDKVEFDFREHLKSGR